MASAQDKFIVYFDFDVVEGNIQARRKVKRSV